MTGTPLTRKQWLGYCGELAEGYAAEMRGQPKMTNDLVARLRDTASQGTFAAIENNRYASPHEAADRIEELEAALGAMCREYGPLYHLYVNGCQHGFKPAKKCPDDECPEKSLHNLLDAALRGQTK